MITAPWINQALGRLQLIHEVLPRTGSEVRSLVWLVMVAAMVRLRTVGLWLPISLLCGTAGLEVMNKHNGEGFG